MSETIIILGGIAIIGYFILAGTKGVKETTQAIVGGTISGVATGIKEGVAPEEVKITESLASPGSIQEYGNCKRSSECQGGTNVGTFGNLTNCINGKCVPMVKKDDILQGYWSPYDLGLKNRCGKFYLMGDGMKCDTDSQCGTNYEFSEAGKEGNKSATVSSETYCSKSSGRCQIKGRSLWGIGPYYKTNQDDPLSGPDVVWPENVRSGFYQVQNKKKIDELSKTCEGLNTLI